MTRSIASATLANHRGGTRRDRVGLEAGCRLRRHAKSHSSGDLRPVLHQTVHVAERPGSELEREETLVVASDPSKAKGRRCVREAEARVVARMTENDDRFESSNSRLQQPAAAESIANTATLMLWAHAKRSQAEADRPIVDPDGRKRDVPNDHVLEKRDERDIKSGREPEGVDHFGFRVAAECSDVDLMNRGDVACFFSANDEASDHPWMLARSGRRVEALECALELRR